MAGDQLRTGGAGGGEHAWHTGLHPVVFSGAASMAAFIGFATYCVVTNNPDLEPATAGRVAIGGALLAAASMLPTGLRWFRARLEVSAQGLTGRVGGLRIQTLELAWRQIEDVQVEQTRLGHWLGYGTLRILTDDGAVEGFSHVRSVEELSRRLLAHGASSPRR